MKNLFSILLCITCLAILGCQNRNKNVNNNNINVIGQGYENGHKYVDLGLPSGILWATCNVGASSPTECGDYFCWGEIQTKSFFDGSTYKWGDRKLTKYCSLREKGVNGITDNKTLLDIEDDAACANWGGQWRMPLREDWIELIENCTWTWGRNGCVVKGTNGNRIFLPAAGYAMDEIHNYKNILGMYWSCETVGFPKNAFEAERASCILFDDHAAVYMSSKIRCYGCPIRPVCR